MATGGGTQPRTVPTKLMTLLLISVPIMVLAIGIAVLPLMVLSHADHRHRMREGIPGKQPGLGECT